jgi:hypothetical protein
MDCALGFAFRAFPLRNSDENDTPKGSSQTQIQASTSRLEALELRRNTFTLELRSRYYIYLLNIATHNNSDMVITMKLDRH